MELHQKGLVGGRKRNRKSSFSLEGERWKSYKAVLQKGKKKDGNFFLETNGASDIGLKSYLPSCVMLSQCIGTAKHVRGKIWSASLFEKGVGNGPLKRL